MTTYLEKLIDVLRLFSNSEILRIERNYDQQYKALKYLYERIRGCTSKFLMIVTLNALICYQLNCRGEEYWWEFAKYFSQNMSCDEGIISLFRKFLNRSKCNKRLFRQKLRRIYKSFPCVKYLCSNMNNLLRHFHMIPRYLSRCLGCSPKSKTIVFATKMLNYALRIVTNKDLVAPLDISIPIDFRIKQLSQKLGIKKPQEFWDTLASKLKISPLHLDSLLWISYRYALEGKRTGNKKLDELVAIIEELIKLEARRSHN